MGRQETGQEPLVSVIMPCYNDGAYLPESVLSLREQTWPAIELILIDDGSDDPETIQAISNLDYPRKNILHTNHIGPAAARNRGIEAARGDFILPLDADDRIEPTYLAKAMEIMTAHPDAGIVYCRGDLFGEQEGSWDLPDYNLRSELLDNCIFVTALFRKADWKAAGGFCETFRAGMEDYDFWLSLLGMGREVYQIPETLFHYRIKPVSRTTRFQHSYADIQATYVQLYQRHKAFYKAHMDEYCMVLRQNLIDQLMMNKKLRAELEEVSGKAVPSEKALLAETSALDDPLVEYILSVRRRKPRLGRFFDRILTTKDGIMKLIGRR